MLGLVDGETNIGLATGCSCWSREWDCVRGDHVQPGGDHLSGRGRGQVQSVPGGGGGRDDQTRPRGGEQTCLSDRARHHRGGLLRPHQEHDEGQPAGQPAGRGGHVSRWSAGHEGPGGQSSLSSNLLQRWRIGGNHRAHTDHWEHVHGWWLRGESQK